MGYFLVGLFPFGRSFKTLEKIVFSTCGCHDALQHAEQFLEFLIVFFNAEIKSRTYWSGLQRSSNI